MDIARYLLRLLSIDALMAFSAQTTSTMVNGQRTKPWECSAMQYNPPA
jgi:hypothetical protein